MILTYLGLTHLNNSELWLLLLLAITFSIALGWAMDLIMRRVGFGVFGNAGISLVGIGVGLASFIWTYRVFNPRTTVITLLFVVGSIMALLLFFSWLTRVLKL
jgi:hypothetical protein